MANQPEKPALLGLRSEVVDLHARWRWWFVRRSFSPFRDHKSALVTTTDAPSARTSIRSISEPSQTLVRSKLPGRTPTDFSGDATKGLVYLPTPRSRSRHARMHSSLYRLPSTTGPPWYSGARQP